MYEVLIALAAIANIEVVDNVISVNLRHRPLYFCYLNWKFVIKNNCKIQNFGSKLNPS